MNPPKRGTKLPNWAVAGLLAVLVGGTYLSSLGRVSTDDLEKELQRELEEEARQQARQQAKSA